MIDFDDDHGIRDENGNEQLQFQTTASAVNHFDITNAATGNSPTISAVGGDTNIDLTLVPKGSGVGKLTNANGTSSTTKNKQLMEKVLSFPWFSDRKQIGEKYGYTKSS